MQTSEIATNLTHHFQGDDTENKVNVEQEVLKFLFVFFNWLRLAQENNHHSSVSGLDRSNATPEIVEQKVGARVVLVYVHDLLTVLN